MGNPLVIRNAVLDDLPRLTSIYNSYVRNSHVTFDVEEFTAEQRMEWYGHYATAGPYRLLVAERHGTLIGYATSSPFRPKAGYRTTVETSVYLDETAIGHGVGTKLYAELMPLVDAAGAHRALAGIAPPNPGSVALHRKFSFVEIGTFTEVGMKFGRYIDVRWFERRC